MASGNASTVYLSVVEEVLAKVRKEFITSGVGDAVLNELQSLWETKLLHCGAISGNTDRNRAPPASASPVRDLNVPYEATSEEYATPTADMLFPPTPLQTPIQTPLEAGIDTGPLDYAPSPISAMRNGMGMMNGADPETGRPSPFMQPPSPWMNQRPLGLDVNLAFAYDEEIRMMMQPQPLTTKDFLMMSCGKRKRDEYPSAGSFVPQQDGCADQVAVHYDATPDYNTPGESSEYQTPTPAVATPKPRNDTAGGEDDDEPPLNEDDDDDDDIDDDFDETQHLVLAQFDKITRTKNRWKCTLKGGIMHLNGRDVLFNKASGEFDF
ncbi:transcription initiation factor IIA subunit 1-like isoform X1 [Triticum urartu]|nr:transcription initiation factor IIA subunit 1-like isoform X1 [Triticum urartu]